MKKISRKNELIAKYSNLEYSKDLVEWSKRVDKQILKLPAHIQEQFMAWVYSIKRIGITDTRKTPGFHDEPLKGKRFGQRSVRLNRAYRSIYIEGEEGSIRIIKVIEVNKHEY